MTDTISSIEELPLRTLAVDTPKVDRMLAAFNNQWNATAADCLRRAEELETAATDLRDRAELLQRATHLTNEVKEVVLFEIQARERAFSLALVKINSNGDGR